LEDNDFLAALLMTGSTHHGARWPINGEAVKTYVRNELFKTLKPGDIVVLDNLGSHRKAVRNMIRNAARI